MKKIYCYVNVSEQNREILQQNITHHELFFHQDFAYKNEGLQVFKQCSLALGNPPLDWINQNDQLEWIQLESVGLDPYQDTIKAGKILFSNMKGFFSRPVAETVLAGILMIYRQLPRLLEAQKQLKWIKMDVRFDCMTIEGKRIVILGGGSIGQMIKTYLQPFGGEIFIYDIYQPFSDFAGIKELEETLQQTDILIGCLPENKETINFLDYSRLNKLPENAIVVNVGRGTLIDEHALKQLLREQKLMGAFLDVTRQEPIPADSDLWETPNLYLSQHTGGGTVDEEKNKIKFFAENFKNFTKGQPLNIIKND